MVRVPMVLLPVCGLLAAQSAQTPKFDAASLKPTPSRADLRPAPPRHTGGPGTGDPTRIDYRGLPLGMLIAEAYDVAVFDLVGPAWATSREFGNAERFDIQASLPPQTTKEDFRLMLQNLLAERFALQAHREKKEVPAYRLVVDKNGPKLKPSPAVPEGESAADKTRVGPAGSDGFPTTPPGYSGMFVHVRSGLTQAKFIGYSMDKFAQWTRTQSKRPGVDSTGLAGLYDFHLDFGNEIGATSDTVEQAPDFAVALQKQLGLKLVPDKTTVELLVIDHINRTPSGN